MRRVVVVVVLGCLLAAGAFLAGRATAPVEPATAGRAGPVDDVLPGAPGAVVPLPSSGWEPGDDALMSLMTGVVRLRSDGCVVAGPPEPQPVAFGTGVALLWPAGWSARRGAGGRVEILDPRGGIALREGDAFEVGGGGGGGDAHWACERWVAGQFAMHGTPRKVPAPDPAPVAGPGAALPLLTSSWMPDQPAMTDLFTGRVLASEGTCVFGRPAAPARAGERTALVWPAGWTAQRSASDGRVEILGIDRQVMLREGDLMTLGGGLRPHPAAAASSCVPGDAEAFLVHRGVTVARAATPGNRGG